MTDLEVADLVATWPEAQQRLFLAEYALVRKHRGTALLLTLLGGLGLHRFYLGQVGLGVLYLVFCWTYIPAIVAVFELFVIGRRVDAYNRQRAERIAARIQAMAPPAAAP